MTSRVDFDRYWGAQLSAIEYDCKSMSMVFVLFWTIDSRPCCARLQFNGVSRCELAAEKVFESEVVELVSLEGRHADGYWHIAGELSNYEFSIRCVDIQDDAS
ncbi:hypothetical protein J7I44_13585 [Frateuria sp. MAH-13]|uniref:Uncharacterized protein n=1 Tax=Frateuria flava TaxID=2821489 RepID=A0ABS4DQK0_9GAMM|nr:hypothetical protein [Frateuria flava]MBP1475339.1 hypothetical protein [Frateuria flava]